MQRARLGRTLAKMKTFIKIYDDIVSGVKFFYKQLKLDKQEKSTGRPLAITNIETISLALYKQANGIPTKKSIHRTFRPNCTYKTLVVNMNRLAMKALLILLAIIRFNRDTSHPIKHVDSTDIPVCLNKNAKHHKTMCDLAEWGRNGKGFYYGLKLHIATDLKRNLLSVAFTPGNTDDRKPVKKLVADMTGIFVADAGYISQTLANEIHVEGKRLLMARAKRNMKKLWSEMQEKIYDTRMLIELNFRNLKMFYDLVTSLPRSIDGYLANYVYSLLGYVLA